MAFRYSIRISGSGGHGVIQAARILAEAAAIYDNKNAAESCSYGPEARGSASRAEVIISDETIDYPKVDAVDFLMALTQEAFDKYVGEIVPSGTVVVDNNIDVADKVDGLVAHSVPLVEIAEKETGKIAMVNIVALGYFAQASDIIGERSIRQAILARIPKMSEGIFMRAYEAGLKAAGATEK